MHHGVKISRLIHYLVFAALTYTMQLKQSLSAVRGHLVRDAKANVLELFPYLANARNNTERRERTLHLLEKDRFLVPDEYHHQQVRASSGSS